MADGNVSTHNNQYSLKIHIQLKDRELIDNFVKDIGCTNSIIEKNNFFRPTGKYHQSCYVSITSVHMVKALMENGVVPNKTKAECIPNIPEHLIQHFIRGFFDGDGIVSCTDKSHSAGFVSNNEMLEQIENYVQLGNKIAPHWKTEGIGTILTNSVKKIAKLYDYLYKDATIYLQRKHDALKAITNGNTEVTN
jgi:intein-encoded DNA endonuclease-like protein